MKIIICTVCIILSCCYINAQLFVKPHYTKATIITKTDTISCYIENRHGYEGKVKYKLDKESKKPLKINAGEIEHIIRSVDKYDRVHLENTSYLMKLKTEGDLALYVYEYISSSPKIYTGNGFTGGGKYEIETFYLRKAGLAYIVKKRNLHKLLKELMKDDKELYADIDKLKYSRDLMFKFELTDLISKYNRRKKYK